ncbi:MAG: DUF3576 domain-containing protein [Rhodospirillaceae bacterium]|jgi:hypothetical protein|nr:DUF3576 domain-containing protein [Rhodospirillaceae bacterium]MBT3932435.1 DUF3576 domain-containing protein [Rhodospirillaceae bacterium]MBT4772516.1 DUF3576 domain-containing protein [Rhodospirillaceae bacterium]MBT5358105.1 DUF3576 domain-containing protein [Rhodospirillaceae bacterium]MBT5769346.1 DUF3576 domain-containing protein [Rhodospirillaceae bacterium]
MSPKHTLRVAAVLLLMGLTACAGIESERADADDFEDKDIKSGGKLFGDINLLGGGDDEPTNSGIGVNAFLWRASLDTLSFLPLSSADPFGGVIITDWYAPPESPEERFKVTVFILGRELRSDGVRVSVFRQKRDDGAGWLDANTGKNTSTSLENAILTRARELRISQPGG